jgi:hypothetical protein
MNEYAKTDRCNKEIYNCGSKIACQFCSDSVRHNSSFPVTASYGCVRKDEFKIKLDVV